MYISPKLLDSVLFNLNPDLYQDKIYSIRLAPSQAVLWLLFINTTWIPKIVL